MEINSDLDNDGFVEDKENQEETTPPNKRNSVTEKATTFSVSNISNHNSPIKACKVLLDRSPLKSLVIERLKNAEVSSEPRRSLRAAKPRNCYSLDSSPSEDSTRKFPATRRSSIRDTPKRTLKTKARVTKKVSDDDDDSDYQENDTSPKSPEMVTKRKSSVRTPKSRTPKVTSRSSACKRKILDTPSAPKRFRAIQGTLSPLQEAQACLHVSAVPDSLPCREVEFAEVYTFAESKIREKSSGCMYLSGVPGTGKTATVKEVIRTLKEQANEGDLEDFQFIEINGMRLTEPNQAYVQIWKHLTGQRVTATHAHDLLEKHFSKPSKKTTVILVDELDMLWNRKQTVLYNIFDWPTKLDSRLVILAIANTMDLPEKMMMNRVSSRLGLTRLQFAPYTYQQLEEIVKTRLTGLKVFDSDAITLVSRKVASLSGDARRALDICRRATEIAQRDSKSHVLVGNEHVTMAHQEMFCSPRILAIRNCSEYKKIFLRCIVNSFRSSGIEETTFEDVYTKFSEYIVMSKLPTVNTTFVYNMTEELAALRLILAEAGRLGPQLRIWLNVSVDDVQFALDAKKV